MASEFYNKCLTQIQYAKNDALQLTILNLFESPEDISHVTETEIHDLLIETIKVGRSDLFSTMGKARFNLSLRLMPRKDGMLSAVISQLCILAKEYLNDVDDDDEAELDIKFGELLKLFTMILNSQNEEYLAASMETIFSDETMTREFATVISDSELKDVTTQKLISCLTRLNSKPALDLLSTIDPSIALMQAANGGSWHLVLKILKNEIQLNRTLPIDHLHNGDNTIIHLMLQNRSKYSQEQKEDIYQCLAMINKYSSLKIYSVKIKGLSVRDILAFEEKKVGAVNLESDHIVYAVWKGIREKENRKAARKQSYKELTLKWNHATTPALQNAQQEPKVKFDKRVMVFRCVKTSEVIPSKALMHTAIEEEGPFQPVYGETLKRKSSFKIKT